MMTMLLVLVPTQELSLFWPEYPLTIKGAQPGLIVTYAAKKSGPWEKKAAMLNEKYENGMFTN